MTESISVTHFLGFLLDVNGNLQRALYEAIHVAKHGVKVNFLVSEKVVSKNVLAKSIPHRYHDCVNINFYPVRPLMKSRATGWRWDNLLSLPIAALKLRCVHKDDIIHVHAPTPVARSFSTSIIKKALKRPMVLDLHDAWSGNPFSLSPILFLQTKLMKYAINNADVVVTAHKPLITLIKTFNNRVPVALIPNGVDTEVFKPRPRSMTLMGKLNLNFNDVVLMFSGHITEEKGLDVLVYAAKIVTKYNGNIKFLIIGDGPIKDRIEMAVKNLGLRSYFRFTGFISVEEMSEYFSLADICVTPYKPMSHYNVMRPETPMKVVQYMSMGKPLIMSRVSDENAVTWSDCGILVDPGNAKKLAEGIISLVEDKNSRVKMGARGREYVKRHLGWSSITKRLIKVYQSL